MDWISIAIKVIADLTSSLLKSGMSLDDIKARSQDELGRILVVEKTEEERQQAIFKGND